MSTPSNDAQRELEQRALRNVRGLVDKIEDAERLEGRAQRRVLVGLVAGCALAVAVVVAAYALRDRDAGAVVELPAPAAPGR